MMRKPNPPENKVPIKAKCAVLSKPGLVALHFTFGKEECRMTFTANEARQLAYSIITSADAADGREPDAT